MVISLVKISTRIIQRYLSQCDSAANTTDQGRLYEDLACYVFEKVPGIVVSKRNEYDILHTQEIDVSFWNDGVKKGFNFFPNIINVECKNWSRPVGGPEITWFKDKLVNRARKFGIFIARNGLSGDPVAMTGAYRAVVNALRDGIEIVVLTGDELELISSSDDLILICKQKLCSLAIAQG